MKAMFQSFLLGALVFPLLALAQSPVVLDPESFESIAGAILEAVTSRNWALAASLGVVVVVYLLRKLGGQRIPFLRTDRGGAVLVLATSFAGAVANAILAGGAFSPALLITALTVAIGAAGGYSILLKILFPSDSDAAKAAGAKAAATAKPASVVDIANGQG